MEINRITCGNCYGKGYVTTLKMVENSSCGLVRRGQVVCEQCDGQGYIEYPVFTVEEAKVILKHCGLSTENVEVEE